jgi:hypothetical protein
MNHDKTNQSPKTAKRSYVTLPLGIRVNRRSLYIGSSSFALVLLLLMAVCLYAFSKYQADTQHALTLVEPLPVEGRSPVAQQILAEAAQGSIADAEEAGAVTVQSILASYRAASGLSELQSLIVHSSYLEGGRTFSMDLAAKAPGLVRKTLSDPTTKITCSFDGEAVQIKVEDTTGQGATQQVQDVLYRQAIMLEGALFALASSDPYLEMLHRREADQTYASQLCWTIVSHSPLRQPITHLIDSETGYERARYVTCMHEGQSHQLSVHLSDYRPHGGGHLPFRYTLKIDGVSRGEARIESIQINPGLMPWMFSANATGCRESTCNYNGDVGHMPSPNMGSRCLYA